MLVRCAYLLALVAALTGAGTYAEGPYAIGTNVQITIERPGVQYYETQIAADPRDARHLIACAYAVRPDRSVDNIFYISFDGGLTWQETLTVPISVDPSCAISPRGTAFASSIHDVPRPDGNTDSTLVVHRSEDGGRTYAPAAVTIDTRRVDRAYLTIDDRRNHVYVHAYLQNPRDLGGAVFTLYASTNGGRSFDQVISQAADGPGTPKFVPANGVVMPDGTFVALTALLDATKLNMFRGRSDEMSAPDLDGGLGVFRSVDGGISLEPLRTIADVHYDWRVPQLSMPSLAVDATGGPFRGRVYAVWPDARLDRRTQIFLSSSADGGRTWTTPRIVSDDATTLKAGDRPNHFMPMVVVNKNGVVGVSWYDRRDNPDNLGYWPRFAASLDGGATWLPSVRLSTSPNATDPAETRLNSGDTAGLAAGADGVFHAAWVDNRTGTHHMWTTAIRVQGTARH